MRNGNYQENVTVPLSREHDNDATADDKIEDINADLDDDPDVTDGVLSAIEKVCIIQSLHESN